MAFDGIVIANIVHDMQSLIGGRISKIAQPESDELLLTIKTSTSQEKLVISANASIPLIYFTDKPKESPLTAPNFCMLLRKHINGGRIKSVSQPSLERIVHIEVEHLDELGDPSRKFIIVELMGKHSNIIFTDAEMNIIDSIKRIPASVSSVREVLPKRKYFLPNELSKKNTLEVSFNDFKGEFSSDLSPAVVLQKAYAGISPVISFELCHRAGIDSEAPTSSEGIDRLYKAFEAFACDIKEAHFSPSIYYENDVPMEFSSYPLTMYEGYKVSSCDNASSMLSEYFSKKDENARMRSKSADLRRITETALAREVKKLDLQLKQLKDTEKKDKFRIYGELIRANAYNIEVGARSVSLENYNNPGEIVTITLDETLSVQENANKYFDKYQKLRRTAAALSELTKETEGCVMQLREISEALKLAKSEEELAQIRDELADAGFIKKAPKNAKGGKKAQKLTGAHGKISGLKCQPIHYVTSEGYDIYVGKNNYQNEDVTFKIAEGNDWWFHAKGIPGSHVIVKNKGTGELPDILYEIAGSIAAYYSSARAGEKVDVDYTQKKNIKKPPASRPGLVIYNTNYSLTITAALPKEIREV